MDILWAHTGDRVYMYSVKEAETMYYNITPSIKTSIQNPISLSVFAIYATVVAHAHSKTNISGYYHFWTLPSLRLCNPHV